MLMHRSMILSPGLLMLMYRSMILSPGLLMLMYRSMILSPGLLMLMLMHRPVAGLAEVLLPGSEDRPLVLGKGEIAETFPDVAYRLV